MTIQNTVNIATLNKELAALETKFKSSGVDYNALMLEIEGLQGKYDSLVKHKSSKQQPKQNRRDFLNDLETFRVEVQAAIASVEKAGSETGTEALSPVSSDTSLVLSGTEASDAGVTQNNALYTAFIADDAASEEDEEEVSAILSGGEDSLNTSLLEEAAPLIVALQQAALEAKSNENLKEAVRELLDEVIITTAAEDDVHNIGPNVSSGAEGYQVNYDTFVQSVLDALNVFYQFVCDAINFMTCNYFADKSPEVQQSSVHVRSSLFTGNNNFDSKLDDVAMTPSGTASTSSIFN